MAFSPNLSGYKDFDLQFEKNELNKDINVRSDMSCINQSIKNILLTFSGERPFSNVGAGLNFYFFDNDNVASLVGAKLGIIHHLNTYEPRIQVEENDITIEKTGSGEIQINIGYTIRNDLGIGPLQNATVILTEE